MGKGGGGGGNRELEDVERNLIERQTQEAASAGARESQVFQLANRDRDAAARQLLPFANELTGDRNQLAQQLARLKQQGDYRIGREQTGLEWLRGQGYGNKIVQLGNTLGNVSANTSSGMHGVDQDLLQSLQARDLGGQVGALGQDFRLASQGLAGDLRGLDTSYQNLQGQNLGAQVGAIGSDIRNTAAGTAGDLRGIGIGSGRSGAEASSAGAQGQQQLLNLSNRLAGGSGAQNQVGAYGNILGSLSGRTGAELSGLRGDALANLEQAQRGEIPSAVSSLVRDANAGRDRDVLELQFQNTRNQMLEGANSRSGNLDRNLAALGTQRALGVAGQEAERTNREREAALGLFGQGIGAGLDAPQTQASLLTQAGGLQGQAEGLRQAGLGAAVGASDAATGRRLQGIQGEQSGLGQQLQSFNLAGQTDLQGMAAQQQSLAQQQQLVESLIGNRAGLLGQAGQADLSGIIGQQGSLGQQQQLTSGLASDRLSALGLIGDTQSQGIAAQQASYAQAQQLLQSLYAQQGAGGLESLMALPGIVGQQSGISQGILNSKGLPSSILTGGGGGGGASPSSYLSSAGQLASGALSRGQQAAAAEAAARSQTASSIAGLGLGALAVFT